MRIPRRSIVRRAAVPVSAGTAASARRDRRVVRVLVVGMGAVLTVAFARRYWF